MSSISKIKNEKKRNLKYYLKNNNIRIRTHKHTKLEQNKNRHFKQ
jgi:hypothetical protein